MKYLGVTIDARMSFKGHFTNAGIMPNIGGVEQPRRLLLSSVVYSLILYGEPIWALCSNPSYGAA